MAREKGENRYKNGINHALKHKIYIKTDRFKVTKAVNQTINKANVQYIFCKCLYVSN